MAKRRHNPRVAKSLRCYTIAETADLYNVHRQTVRNWLANGLHPIDAGRPILIHGTALNQFHNARRASEKQSCGPGELFCLGCRAARRPAGDVADYIPLTERVGALSAICPVCTRMMGQRVNPSRLACFAAEVEVTVRPGPPPLEKSC
jgi:hypothetical protein